MSEKKEKITISLDKDLLGVIDKERGLIPRSTYINEMLWIFEVNKIQEREKVEPELWILDENPNMTKEMYEKAKEALER